ncbi:MAG TPA: pitrilysin family protein [Myxococcaceae bacterium]|jgi:zinc protease
MATRFALDNGLTVVFEEQHAAPVAAFQVWVKAGSADERPDQAGLAHLHEHMLFKGTERRGPGEIARDIESHGGEINAWTSFDQTVYHIVLASQFARMGMDVLADAIRRSAFDREELAREIEVVCEEIKRADDMPMRRASKDLFSTLYQAHPYQRPVIGWPETVRSFTREKVLEFYTRHYAPQNMVLAVVGDLREGQVRDWAGELFGGDWGRPYAGPVERPREPALAGHRTRFRHDDTKEAIINLAFSIPDSLHLDTPALDTLAMLAGQGESSRLGLEIKRRLGLTNEVHMYAYTPKNPGVLNTTLMLQPEQAAAALEQTIKCLQQLARVPVPSDELETVKKVIESDAIYQRETVEGVARKMGYYETGMGGLEAEAVYYERIAALTPERIQEVAARYLRWDACVLTALWPEGSGFTEAQGLEIVQRAAAAPSAAPERKVPKAEAPQPISVAVRGAGGKTGIVVERLPSGAQIVIREESSVPLFAMRAAFQGSVRYENDALNGRTALLSRMMTRGTPSHDAEEISHLLDRYSGGMGTQAGRSSISLHAEFLSRHFRNAFDLFGEVINAPTFPEKELDRERKLLLQDIATRDDKPSAVAFDLFCKALFRRHPYRLPQLGEEGVVEKLTADALRDYHRKYMDPSQLTLAVVGDVKVDQVMAAAEKHFGRAREGAAPPPEVPQESPTEPSRTMKKTLVKQQTHAVLGFLGLTLRDPRRRTQEVLSTVLSGQGGRLFVELRDKRSMAYSVTGLAAEGVDPGYFGVYIGTSPEKAEQAIDGIKAELRRVREEPITTAELERAQQHMVGTHAISLQRNASRAALFGLDYLYGMNDENFTHYADQVWAVTPEKVQQLARELIDFERCVTAIVGP